MLNHLANDDVFLLRLPVFNCRPPLHLLEHLRLLLLHDKMLLLLVLLRWLLLLLLIHGLMILLLEVKGDHFRVLWLVWRYSSCFLLKLHDIIIVLAILT